MVSASDSVSGSSQRPARVVAWVVAGIAWVLDVERWGATSKTAAADVYLFVTVLLGGLRFVEALEGTVMAFVEMPVLYHRYPAAVHGCGGYIEGVYGAFQIGGEVVVGQYAGSEAVSRRLPVLPGVLGR